MPLPPSFPSPQHPGPATRKLLRAETALQQRVEFEGLVYRLQNHFANLPSQYLDWGIEEALGAMGEYKHVSHAHIFRVYDQGRMLDHTHEWSADGRPTAMRNIQGQVLDEIFPWAAQRLRRLDGIAIYSVASLSPAAARERAILEAQGVRSLLLVPMSVRGALVGFLGFDSTTTETDWDADSISLLKMCGSSIADALERQRAENAQAQLVGILEAGSDLVAIAEKESQRLTWLNRAGRAMLGLEAAEDLSLWRISDIVPHWVWELKVRACYPVVEAVGSWTGESAILTRDGHEVTVSEMITRLPSQPGTREEGYAFIIRDITEQKRLEKEVLDIAEREQSRFGHDLHDGLGQHLTGVQFMAQVLHQRLEDEGRPEAVEAGEIAKLIREGITQTRDLARGLSPVVLQSKSLQDALRDLTESISRRGQARCTADLDEDIAITNSEAAIQLYRIAQEAVNNALKHGGATDIVVVLRHDSTRIELMVSDNGQGFPADFQPGQGMGLRVMNYRAGLIGGSLEILQRDGQTQVSCTVDEEQLNRQNLANAPAPVIRRE